MRPSRLLPLAGWLLLAGCESDLPDATPRPGVYDPDVLPGPGSLPRLTRSQYRHAITDLLGPAIVVPAALEPDIPIEGSVALGTTTLAVSARGVGLYERAAYAIAEQAMAEGPARDALVTCAPTGPGDAACAGEVLAPLARRAYRRTPSPEELEALVAVAVNAGATLGDFHDGLEYGIAAILMGGVEDDIAQQSQDGTLDRVGYDTLVDRGNTYELTHQILLGVGLVTVVSGGIWLLVDGLSEPDEDAHLTPRWDVRVGPRSVEALVRF